MHTLDDDLVLVPISAIEHYSYCPRQCALIHVEQTYDENLYTMRGKHAHERVHTVGGDIRRGVTVRRGLSLWSRRLHLTGKADAVEFHDQSGLSRSAFGSAEDRNHDRVPYPVEYKVGARKAGGHEDLQLCAQALCLEEMFGMAVPEGAIYYHASRHRQEIPLDAALRARTEEVIMAIRQMLDASRLPTAPNDARCRHCSLFESCLPGVVSGTAAERRYHAELFVIAPGADG